VFYLRRRQAKLAVNSSHGKEAILTLLGDGESFGEGCLAGQLLRLATATAMSNCTLTRTKESFAGVKYHGHPLFKNASNKRHAPILGRL
jgi:hypothetical protein